MVIRKFYLNASNMKLRIAYDENIRANPKVAQTSMSLPFFTLSLAPPAVIQRNPPKINIRRAMAPTTPRLVLMTLPIKVGISVVPPRGF